MSTLSAEQLRRIIETMDLPALERLHSAVQQDDAAQMKRAWKTADDAVFGQRDPRYGEVQGLRRLALERATSLCPSDQGLQVSAYISAENAALSIIAGNRLAPALREFLLGPWRRAGLLD